MNRKYIWLLTGIMSVTMIWLVIVQARWIKNALLVKEQEFGRTVNKALFQVVTSIEERETVMQITNETVFLSQDTNEFAGSKILLDGKFPVNADTSSKKSFFVVEGDSVLYEADNKSDSLDQMNKRQRDEIKNKIIKNISKKTVFIENIINKLIRKEVNVNERIDKKTLKTILDNTFTSNNIKQEYEFGVRDETNTYTMNSEGFNLDYVNKTYEILLFPNDILTAQNYLVVYFKKDKKYFFEAMPETIMTSIFLTVIISLTFSLTIFIIYRQRKLSEIKNDFINNMTHELKTPVSTISLASQMLKDETLELDRHKIAGITKIIDDESKRLGFQIEKVLQTSLFDKGVIQFKFKQADIHEILNAVSLNMNLKVKNLGGTISKKFEAQNPNVEVDEMHITNVFFNLLDNAVKYSNDENTPEIEIYTFDTPKNLHICFDDNGIGISKENHKKIFNKFFRVQKGDVHDVKGFGLGLSYVKRIVGEHKGTITVKSELGIGTRFEIILPKFQ
jgi:signal transduction histidine kinase